MDKYKENSDFKPCTALQPHPVMEKVSRANLNEKPGVGPLQWLDDDFVLLLAAPAAKSVPNVLLCSPLDYMGEAERGILSNWAPKDFHTLCPCMHLGEVTPVPLFTVAETTWEAAVMSCKSRPIGIDSGAVGCL